jgi:hypothetical protein
MLNRMLDVHADAAVPACRRQVRNPNGTKQPRHTIIRDYLPHQRLALSIEHWTLNIEHLAFGIPGIYHYSRR